MKTFLNAIVLFCLFGSGHVDQSLEAQTNLEPYRLSATIELPGVKGGFDHFAYDSAKQRLFLAASDDGTLEVMDLNRSKAIATIHGFVNPHSILLRPETHQILITDSGEHASRFLDTTTLKITRSLNLALGANCILLDPNGTRLYVTAGGDRVKQTNSVVQVINPDTGDVLRTAHIPALHLQPMAIDAQNKRLFVNVADQDTIAVLKSDSLQQLQVWHIPRGHKNSPIVFDQQTRTLFVIASDPGILMALDPVSGAMRVSVPTPPAPDDLGFDPQHRRLFVPGRGALNIYQIGSAGSLRLLQHIETGPEARTGVFLQDQGAFAVAVPATTTRPARVLVFSPAD